MSLIEVADTLRRTSVLIESTAKVMEKHVLSDQTSFLSGQNLSLAGQMTCLGPVQTPIFS